MRILVTGARGKVGAAAVDALLEAGHEVTGCDLAPPVYEGGERRARYFRADLTDAGDAFAAVRDHAVVIHAAALPEPTQNPPHTVFGNNVMATFNVAEACVRLGVARIVNVSSETITGFGFAERPFFSPYAPIDEALPNRPQDPYALAKLVGEQIMDATVARSDVRAVSIRPTWVQWEGNYARSLGPWLLDPGPSQSFWSYIDVYDLADALRLAAESSLDGHEAMYIAAADHGANRPLPELIRTHFPGVELRGSPESGISTARAAELLGYRARRSWRDYLTPDGELLAEARERLERGETGVQRGLASTR